jgi:uncharacterized protein YjiS (DUF1127 family)
MNQIIRPETGFRSARPASAGAVPRITIRTEPERPRLLARLADRIRRYLAVRRTLRALDGLSEEQLKDIGYRRVPGDPSTSRYERLP